MKILVLGNGGREHALAWKIKQSPACQTVLLHPGNAGTRRAGFSNLGDNVEGIDAIIQKAKDNLITLVVIGPEVLLAGGYADKFREAGFLVVGPSQVSSQLETSKIFAKEFMIRAGVPTATFSILENLEDLKSKIPTQWPSVLKLDGLAAGKGVVIAENAEQMIEFGERVWNKREFGETHQRILLEKFIPGRELSYLGLCDGHAFIPLSSATDFKRAYDDDKGPNTGGMGAVSPSPYFSAQLERKIQERIVNPIMTTLRKETLPYQGVLYIGLMINQYEDPFVLEFNARFGDPETQALMLRLQSDLIPLLEATAKGTLSDCAPAVWKTAASVYVVAAAEGYPGKTKAGDIITTPLSDSINAEIFFSGVESQGENLITHGGRILGVGALGANFTAAREKAYQAMGKIRFSGMHFRSDIGLARKRLT